MKTYKIMLRSYAVLLFALLLTQVLTAQYTPVTLGGQTFFKVEVETDNNFLLSEITITDFDLIDDVYYNRVFFKLGLTGDVLIGHVREDATIGELYFRPVGGTDQLTFDISMEPGDSITLQARWCDGLSGNVAHVVAEEEIDGRKVLTFDREVGYNQICETLQFIEGIGPNTGVIMPWLLANTPEGGAALRICHAARGGAVFYPADSPTDFCGNKLVVAHEPEEKNWHYDLSGRLLLQEKDTYSVDISTLCPGLYLLALSQNDKILEMKKLVKI